MQGVYQESIALDQPFEQAAQAFSKDQGTVLLLSGSFSDASEYHILAIDPWLELSSRQETINLQCQGKAFCFRQDPFSVVEALLERFSLDAQTFNLPVHAGLFGYFAYDLKDRIERLPVTCMDTHLPDMVLYAPSIILIQKIQTGQTTLCIPLLNHDTGFESEKGAIPDMFADHLIEKKRQFFYDRMNNGSARKFEKPLFFVDSQGFESSFTKHEYMAAAAKIIGYLNAGDIYQANLSQRFEAGFSGDAYSLFLDLYERNPASFFSYIQACDHTIVSTSPERFIKQSGRHVETRPIKGTIVRGETQKEDQENSLTLSQSVKDDAELTMIVDLMRNDFSRVTCPESVVVKEHKRLEPYENVFHLVSIVQGVLKEGKTSVDLLKATFPGGSITGCPKIRSMEIIDELEPVKRHVYTGSIGYISFHDTMDLSIAIRTATIVNHTVFFSVGGGIVYDSDPEKEFQETIDKGKTLMDALSSNQKSQKAQKIKAWIDGKMVDQDQAMVPATSAGFQYGAGLFETIKVENGYIYRLNDHVDRLNRSWEALFSTPWPDITWKNVIDQLIDENQFENKTLAIKLLVSKDEQDNGKRFFLAAFAREYAHRLDVLKKTGLDLVTYPHPRQTPLADQKTLNYLYYERAGQFAKSCLADEAIVLNPDHTISETNTANIIAIKGQTVIVPVSDHVLEGVTIKAVLKILSDKGYQICEKSVTKDEFFTYPNIILTNALMGAVKALTIDKKSIKQEKGVCTMINKELFKR
ncbi:MAG: bifunctional anthranilate synthase component I family protein/aminotransferase class IV [Pseudomonadota bacterium]